MVIILPEVHYEVTMLVSREKVIDLDVVSQRMGRKREDLMRIVAELERYGFIQVRHIHEVVVKLTDRGQYYLNTPLPEERIIEKLDRAARKGEECISVKVLRSGLGSEEFSAAIGRLRRYGTITLKDGHVCFQGSTNELKEYLQRLRSCLEKLRKPQRYEFVSDCYKFLHERGYVTKVKRKRIELIATNNLLEAIAKGEIKRGKVVTKLTPELIASGKWREVVFKRFDLNVEVPMLATGRRHPLTWLYEYVKEVLESMGFVEVEGSFVEYSLWNFDALMVPQYHPAYTDREVFRVKNAKLEQPPIDVINRVRREHEYLYGYKWRAELALRLLLRTHTTAISMRMMYSRGGGEYRVFTIDRVFRPDTPDPTHSMEFHQLEGIIVGKNVRFNDLLSFFTEFTRRLGLGKVFFKPAYFPFTEPSVEGFIYHPRLGKWIEVYPGGMFRPSVLRVAGINPEEYKVIAWGIGIDRIAMLLLDIDNIRLIYTNDVDYVRRIKLPLRLMLHACSKR